MKKIIFPLFAIFLLTSACENTNENKLEQTKVINDLLDEWHLAATNADFDNYFQKLDENSIYIGTDAGELWTKAAFIKFAKPYFDKGKTWDFKAIQRNIYLSDDFETAWFDELLDTWMGDCRASGVVIKSETGWKIKHYQLSVTVPNEKMKSFLKAMNESPGKTKN